MSLLPLESQSNKLRTNLIVCAALVIILSGIDAASTVLVPFLLATFISIICYPFLQRLKYHGLPEWAALMVVLAIIVVFGIFVVLSIGRSLIDVTRLEPEYRQQIGSQMGWMLEKMAAFNMQMDRQELMEHLNPRTLISMIVRALSGLGGVMGHLMLILLAVAFMLSEASSITGKIYLALRDPEAKMQQIQLFLTSVNRYLAIKTLISLLTGLSVGVLLWALDVRYYVLWSMMAFLLNYIPSVGSIIAAIPVVIQVLLFQGPLAAFAVIAGYLVINTVLGGIIEPRWMGRDLGLSTLVVFLSLIFWGWLLGTVGMLLSVPLTMVVKIILESTEQGRWFAVLLGSEHDVERELELRKDSAEHPGVEHAK